MNKAFHLDIDKCKPAYNSLNYNENKQHDWLNLLTKFFYIFDRNWT